MRLLTLFSLFAILMACGTTNQQQVNTPAPEKMEDAAFGAEFEATQVAPADALLASYSPEQIADTVSVQLQGTVNEVCQAKGCWMTIAAGNDEEMMVKFKDYGFFMPKDISEREVIMNGIAYYEVTPVDELRHYAEDAGKSADEIAAITEPKRELKFLADGVKLLPRS